MRKILIELEIDWEDSNDVCDEIMVEDAIQAKCEGVGWKLAAPQRAAEAKELEPRCGKCGAIYRSMGLPFCTDDYCKTNKQ